MSTATSTTTSSEQIFKNDSQDYSSQSPIPPLTTTGVLPPTAGLMQTQSLEALKDITYGSIAGSLGKVIEYPFDTVKVRLQSQPSGHQRYTGPIDCFAQSIRAEGISGLYRGISAPLIGAAVETSSLFFSYRIAQTGVSSFYPSLQSERLPLSGLVLCGALSGAFTSLLLTPIELVKCQMQVPLSEQARLGASLRSPLSIISEVFRSRGVLGFWHGQLGTLIRETGGSAAWFGSYEGVTAFFKARQPSQEGSEVSLPIWQRLLAGATAGMTYNFLFFPADTVKSRQQTDSLESGRTTQRKFMDVSRALYAEHGVRGFYRGCGITVARAAPSSAFIFTIYEGLRGWLG